MVMLTSQGQKRCHIMLNLPIILQMCYFSASRNEKDLFHFEFIFKWLLSDSRM